MTSFDTVQQIREELKKNGFNRTLVTVKNMPCGYSTSIQVTVRKLSISLKEIEAIVLPFSYVDYDERTHEVMMGGNTYINCSYRDGLIESQSDEHLQQATLIWEKLIETNNNINSPIAKNDNFNLLASSYVENGQPNVIIKLVDQATPNQIDERFGRHVCYSGQCLAEFLTVITAQIKDLKICA